METEVYDYFYHAEEAHWWFRARRRVLASVLRGVLPTGSLRIADVGCGTGGMLGVLSELGTVTGVDAAPEARDYCRRRGFDNVLDPDTWARDGASYDLVTAFDVVEHVEDDVGFLRMMANRLAPGGRLCVTVPAYQFLWSTFDEMNHHKRRYSRRRLVEAMNAAGLRVTRSTHFNTLLFPPIAAVRLLEKTLRADPTDPEEKKRSLARWFKVGPLNGPLEAVFASERHALAGMDLPVGCSILALAESA